ncbi:Hypothetical protein HVR_LOCUS354 [uncultured virus]|nr:Hypothetical protein HVR_LOCUS354 [uncultured virus]
MWYDIDISPDDPNPFFFKNDPITYLENLQKERWIVRTYAGTPTDEAKKIILHQKNPEEYLSQKLNAMIRLFGKVLNFISETRLPKIVRTADASSFVIINPNRPFHEGIARYSPIEIFELVDPPTVPRYNIVGHVNTSYTTRNYQINTYLRMITKEKKAVINPLSNYRTERYDRISRLRPLARVPVFVVWSPAYRYSENDQIQYYNHFDRPDQDNFYNVTVYVWGF